MVETLLPIFYTGFINSVLEESEIPLITKVIGLSLINYIKFSLVLSIFSLFFRKKIFFLFFPFHF